MAGLPQRGETPLELKFFLNIWVFVNLCRHFHFPGGEDRVSPLCHSSKKHHVNRAPVVETCCEEKINANLLSKSQLLPAEVSETEQTQLDLNSNSSHKKL